MIQEVKNRQMKIFKLLLILSLHCYSQKQGNIWYFGNNAGLDFNNGNPTALLNGQLSFPGTQNYNEGTSVISDSSGAVLFYSDGMTVWNKNHLIMQNGTGLLGNFSSTQSSIIVPQPGQPNRYYYIFTVGSMLTGNASDGFRYSKVDLCLDGGLGGVMPTQKNTKLLDTITEKIAVTRHANGTDYWIMTHKFNSDKFFAMRLTANGVVDTVVTSIGSIHASTFNTWVQGQMKFSPNGQKLAVGGAGGLKLLELFDFNKSTGVVSNFMALSRIDNGDVYGVEFSPDNSKLYTQSSSYSPFGLDFCQYDISSGNIVNINASMNSLYHNPSPSSSMLIGLQLATNGKIYMVSNGNYGMLSVINNPNVYGAGCNYQAQAVSLGGKSGSLSLPSFISGFDYSNTTSDCDLITSFDKNTGSVAELIIYPNPSNNTFTFSKIKAGNSIEVFDLKGQSIFKTTAEADATTINLKETPNGIYTYRVINEEGRTRQGKLIVK